MRSFGRYGDTYNTCAPRTANDMLADLLELVERDQWSKTFDVGYRQNPEYRDGCPDCEALRNDGEEPTHEPNCWRLRLMAEANAYLRVEETIDEPTEET